jgi:hypothetical protein
VNCSVGAAFARQRSQGRENGLDLAAVPCCPSWWWEVARRKWSRCCWWSECRVQGSSSWPGGRRIADDLE